MTSEPTMAVDGPEKHGGVPTCRDLRVMAGGNARPTISLALLLVILVVAGMRFLDLGRSDLGKDEALWCTRAKAVAFHDDWLDTTPHSVGKLMVASYPPLHAWLTGVLYKLFGANACTSRVVSAAVGAATVVLVFLMGSLAFGRLAGFFAGLVLGLNFLFFKYSRLGQLEALYLCTIVLALWLYMVHSARQLKRMEEGEHPQAVTLPVVLCGVAFGLALLSKIATGLFVPIVLTPYLVYLVYNRRRSVRGALGELLLIVAIGLIIAGPWHLYMLGKYSPDNACEGKTFLDWFWWHHIVKRSAEPLEGPHHSGYGWGHVFYLNSMVTKMPFTIAMALYGIAVAIKASLARGEKRQHGESRMLFLLWVILTFAVLERSATRMTSYVIPLLPPLALFAGWTLAQVAEGRIGPRGRTLLLGFTLLSVAWMADERPRDAVETFLAKPFGLTPENPTSLVWLAMIPAYVAAAVLLAGLYHVFLSRKVRLARAATAVLVLAVVLGAAGKGTFGKLIAGPDDGTWETLRSVIPAKTDYDMVLSLGHWKDGRQVQYYLDGVAAHWETRMFVELLEPPEDWQSERDEVVGGQPVTFDGRWWVNAEAPLFDPGAWEDADARLENLTDKTVVLILLSDDSVEKKLERLLSERRVLVMLVEDSELGQQYRPLLERLAWPLGRTKELSLHLSGLCND